VVEGGIRVRGGNVELDIGLDLAIGARCAGVEEDAALLAGEIPGRAAAVRETDGRARSRREGVRVERNAGQVACSALSVGVGLVLRPLAAERGPGLSSLEIPEHRPDPLSPDAR